MIKHLLAPVFALSMLVVNPLQAKVEITPFDHIAIMVVLGKCLLDYGYSVEQVDGFLEGGYKRYSLQQVTNIGNRPDFQKRVNNLIADLGGCEQVVLKTEAEMGKRLGRGI